jgi:hypothetical protein
VSNFRPNPGRFLYEPCADLAYASSLFACHLNSSRSTLLRKRPKVSASSSEYMLTMQDSLFALKRRSNSLIVRKPGVPELCMNFSIAAANCASCSDMRLRGRKQSWSNAMWSKSDSALIMATPSNHRRISTRRCDCMRLLDMMTSCCSTFNLAISNAARRICSVSFLGTGWL